ncbi:MAG: ATP-binding cassette domain-containing protein [Paracoccaceae bacterium]
MRDLAESMSDLNTTAEPVMSAHGLSYGTGRETHLGPLDLAIRAGRSTVIMGANGAGKSVLIRLLHGLLTPTRGQILWHGAALKAGARKRQAMVFQRPVLLRRSVLGNLRFALRVRGVRKGDRVAREQAALDAAKLSHAKDRPARRLSIGEQQRLAVARALSTSPEVLFLDEPTASLDPASTLAIEAQIAEAKAAGVTIVLVTHDAGQARRVGDDVIFLDAGRVAEQGRASDVLTAPQSPEAQAWLSGDLRLAASGTTGL